MWAVGINITSTILLETPIAAGGYGFGPKAVGYLYFTPLVAVVLGEAFGQTLEKHLSYAGIIMGWGMYVFGVMLATVAITAYALDSYGSASSEVSGLLNFARGRFRSRVQQFHAKCV